MSTSRTLKYLGFAVLMNSIALFSASAAEAPQTSVGALIGISTAGGDYATAVNSIFSLFNRADSTQKSSIGSPITFGGKVHHKFMPMFGAGINFTYASLGSVTASGADFSNNVMHIDADLDYHFADVLPGLWAGARLGYGILKYTQTGLNSLGLLPSDSQGSFEWGPAAGYDYMITENFSVGVDLSYLLASYKSVSFNTFQALAALKVHF